MTRPRSAYKDILEADWQEQVIDTLHLHGWKVAHFRPAQTKSGAWITPVQADGKGFPDLLCVHPTSGDMLAVELKREYEKASPAQLMWLTWFEVCNVDAFVWRPSDVDAMIERVARPRRRERRAT